MAAVVHQILNLTPHPVVYTPATGSPLTFPASGTIARVSERHVQDDTDGPHGLHTVVSVFGAVIGLPPPHAHSTLIVSGMVRAALPGRTDLLSPGALLRDAAGTIVGCATFIRNPPTEE